METATGVILGIGCLAAAVFIARQMSAATQAQIAALQQQANQGASLGDYVSAGLSVAGAVKGKK